VLEREPTPFDDGDDHTLTASPIKPRDAATTADPEVEIPPSLRDRFEDFVLLGRGGMGAVYRAKDVRLGRAVAIKVLVQGDTEAPNGFLHEARAQARLLHPNVCEVFEAGVADSTPFIVMRFVDGPPLQDATPMSLEEKVRVLRDVALALHEAHRLGMVHRDVKPGNILVERAEDGSWKSYIADFGIARDLRATPATGRVADTLTVQGTPAFMAPEQASGKLGAIDRRTDVYGLGATLYALIAGHPPFQAQSLSELLRRVRQDAPPSLSSVMPSAPADLDAIAMRCLDKNPAARYESARALAEDLSRFLDGDPVLARPRALGVRLWRRALKNKARVALSAALLVAISVLTVFWIRGLRQAQERETLARDLGGAVREMELFLRAGYTLPIHDVELEREVLRARLLEISARTRAAGAVAIGPGEDALGRGLLAMHDAKGALEHFQASAMTGYRAPGFDYSMGLALIARYGEALEKSAQITKASEKAARIAQLEQKYKGPALTHLRAALTQGVESPAYANGLISLHEGHLEEALARAREAFTAAPWLYEAKKLEGDVQFAMGRLTGHDKVFDYQQTHVHFELAAAAYHAAADVARSDPSVHEAECTLWIQAMNAAAEHGDSMRPGFDRAVSACERAIQASPRSPSGYLKLAWAHNCFAYWVSTGKREGESPEDVLSRAALAIEAAARQAPSDPFARYLVGAVWRSKATYLAELGRSANAAIDQAIAGYEAALSADPGMLWALNEQCATLLMRGRREALFGTDSAPTFALALERCGRATALDPDFMFPKAGLVEAHMVEAASSVAAGRSPDAAIALGSSAVNAAESQYPTWTRVPFWRLGLLRIQAEDALSKGGMTSELLERANAIYAPLRGQADLDSDIGETFAQVAEVTAEAELKRLQRGPGKPAPSAELEALLRQATGPLKASFDESPWNIESATWLARLKLTELQYESWLGRATVAEADAALAPLTPLLSEPRDDPAFYELAARVHEARATIIAQKGHAPIERGSAIALARRAVEVGPALAAARVTLARLESERPQTR
jgi:serine/threonine-protein kinase